MNRFIIVLLLCLAPLARAQDWSVISLGTTDTLRAFAQTTPNFGDIFLVGDNGTVVAAFPPFTEWAPVDVGTNADLLSVHRENTTLAWISGRDGVVRVRDNQLNWNVRDIPDATQGYVLLPRGSGRAFAAGSGGSVFTSTDLGQNWALQASGTTASLNAGIGTIFNDGYAVGDGGLILATTNGGATWQPLPSGTTSDLYAIQDIAGSGTLEVAGADGLILTSDDSGATWTQRPTNTTATLRALSGANSLRHLAVGDNGTVLRSTDNGATWCAMDPGVTVDLYAAYATVIPPNDIHVVAGADGVLVWTENGSSASCQVVSNEPEAAAPGHALSAVWPNPARSAATLTFRVDQSQHVAVEVFDVQGRRVAEAFSGSAAAEVIVPVALDAEALAPGTYIVRVQGETFVENRRFVVVK